MVSQTRAPIFSSTLASLFNLSLQASLVPSQWKVACIHPIPKITPPKSPSDYRPISITCILSRILERIVVKNHLYPLFSLPLNDLPNAISFSNQFAYRPTGSTSAAIISILQTITDMLTVHQFVRVFALDFTKAFDTVSHTSLFSKLSALPLDDNIYNWLASFFQDRCHFTKFNAAISETAAINSSVVQGSVLGPVAFCVASSDLNASFHGNTVKKYADDSYLIVPGSNSNTCQGEIDGINRWAKENNLALNQNKCEEIIFTRPRMRSKLDLPDPVPGIARVSYVKILGVIVSENLSVKTHIDATVASCNRGLFALRTLKSHGLAGSALHQVYNAIITSKLLYASSAWWGYATVEDKTRLEHFIMRSKRMGFCSQTHPLIETLVEVADSHLLNQICSNQTHVLHPLLPPNKTHTHSLRPRAHTRQLPPLSNFNASLYIKKNFISRALLQAS